MSRSFVREETGRWTDARFVTGVRTVRVAPFSAAYFALLRELPALQEALSLGEKVLVAGRALAVEIDEGGRETLSDAELREIVREVSG